jgi:hypothetical protein
MIIFISVATTIVIIMQVVVKPEHCGAIFGSLNNVAFPHGLTSSPGFADACHFL